MPAVHHPHQQFVQNDNNSSFNRLQSVPEMIDKQQQLQQQNVIIHQPMNFPRHGGFPLPMPAMPTNGMI